MFAAELRPPRAELATAEGMDAWIDTYHAVRRLTRQGTYVFLTDSAVGAQEEVVPLLSIADVFLLPSAQESFGLAALEAMACEVPVIASRVGGLPEVIEHGVSGFLHPLDAEEEMAASAVALLTALLSSEA